MPLIKKLLLLCLFWSIQKSAKCQVKEYKELLYEFSEHIVVIKKTDSLIKRKDSILILFNSNSYNFFYYQLGNGINYLEITKMQNPILVYDYLEVYKLDTNSIISICEPMIAKFSHYYEKLVQFDSFRFIDSIKAADELPGYSYREIYFRNYNELGDRLIIGTFITYPSIPGELLLKKTIKGTGR